MISVIIPSLNEAGNILKSIDSVRRQDREAEIIVVDGGSQDDTPELARWHAQVITSPRGRAVQMNTGARRATGHVLLFLHGDSRLAPGALAQMQRSLDNPRVAGGSFTLVFDTDNFWLRFYAFCSTIDCLCFRYGDQGIFVRRAVFETMGGFQDIPLMEDIAFCRALKRMGPMDCLRTRAITSARRWERDGVWRTIIKMWMLKLGYLAGVSPERLKQYYADTR